MAALPALRSEDLRARRLTVTKRRATVILAVVAVIWLVITAFAHGSWVGYVQATAEASLVGGLADWFAVTALFRHPLGLPIPHTAIIAERKEQFGATLGDFIQESFLTPDAIVERIRAASVVDRIAEWLAQPANAERLAGQGADGAVAFADLLRDDEIHDALEDVLRQRIDAVELAPLAGRILQRLTKDGRHAEVVDASLRSLDRYLEMHGDELRERLGERAPWWLPGAVEDRLFVRMIDGARAAVRDMVGHPENPLRRDIDASLARLAVDLETSPELRERGERLKQELPEVREWAATLWREAKEQLRHQAAEPTSPLRQRLAAGIVATAARVREDPALKARAEETVENAAVYLADRFHGEIAGLVSGTIARWDTGETSRRLELLLGPDLQYIRINGTVVGGGAGLVLYLLSRLLR